MFINRHLIHFLYHSVAPLAFIALVSLCTIGLLNQVQDEWRQWRLEHPLPAAPKARAPLKASPPKPLAARSARPAAAIPERACGPRVARESFPAYVRMRARQSEQRAREKVERLEGRLARL